MFGAAILLPLIGLLISLAIKIGEGIYDIFTGVAQEFIELPQGLFIGALSGAKMAHALGVFGITNFICGLKMLQNAYFEKENAFKNAIFLRLQYPG